MRALILIGIAELWLAVGVAWGNEVVVSGRVSTLDYGVLVRLSVAKIEFRSANGATVTTTVNDVGEYTVSLDAGLDYTLTVTARGFCPAHRPLVRLNAGRAIKFDFILTTICPGDRIVWGGDKESRDDLYFASSIPYYFEESLALGKNHGRCLIIVFGTRRKGQYATFWPFLKSAELWPNMDRIEYASLPIKTHPGIHLPVTISFDTYTVRSETAVLDRKTRVLEAQGNVSVEDGSDSAPITSSCVTLQLDDSELRPQPCLLP